MHEEDDYMPLRQLRRRTKERVAKKLKTRAISQANVLCTIHCCRFGCGSFVHIRLSLFLHYVISQSATNEHSAYLHHHHHHHLVVILVSWSWVLCLVSWVKEDGKLGHKIKLVFTMKTSNYLSCFGETLSN